MQKLSPALGVNIKDYDAKELLGGKYWRISEKIDGVRKLFYKAPNNKVLCYSRSGKEDKWLSHITKWLEQPHFPNNYIYDTEIVDMMAYFLNVDSFLLRTETNSKTSQQFEDNKGDLMAFCFDMYQPDGDMRTGRERNRILAETFDGWIFGEPIIPIPIHGYLRGNDEMIIESLMKQIEARNGEGLMLMAMDSPYIQGRSKELVKVKRMREFIGRVIGFDVGRDDSKIKGGIAALICDVAGCTVPVKVGTGFTNEMRVDFNDDKIVGTEIEIEAFGYSKDAKGDISLNLPVFKCLVGM